MNKRIDQTSVALLCLLSFPLGVGITFGTKAYPTEPNDWYCQSDSTVYRDGYQLCRVQKAGSNG